MIIAIPSEAPGGLDAPISEHFGHCAAFTLVTVDDGKIGEVKVVANGGHDAAGCLSPVQVLKDLSVDALLTGGMGRRPLAGFQDAGIAVHFREDAGTVREGVERFLAGGCREFDQDDTCGGGHCGHHHEAPPRPPIEGKADVRRGRVITLDFEARNTGGETIDTSADSGPMTYLQGCGLIPGLETAIEGLEAGGRTTVEIPKAFGERDESLVADVPIDRLPAGISVGDALAATDRMGRELHFTVAAMAEGVAKLDGNHPLAGQTIVFDFAVAKVEAALPEELAELPEPEA